MRVELALVGSPNDAAERLLRVSAPPGAIAAPHMPRGHRRPGLSAGREANHHAIRIQHAAVRRDSRAEDMWVRSGARAEEKPR